MAPINDDKNNRVIARQVSEDIASLFCGDDKPRLDADDESQVTNSSSAAVSPSWAHPQGDVKFPIRLHEMLEDLTKDEEMSRVVSWNPEGTAFKVHNKQVFEGKILPQYFAQTKYRSFQRQLNHYGFSRIIKGPFEGGYRHRDFVRSEVSRSQKMRRLKREPVSKKPQATLSQAQGVSPATLPSVQEGERKLVYPPGAASQDHSMRMVHHSDHSYYQGRGGFYHYPGNGYQETPLHYAASRPQPYDFRSARVISLGPPQSSGPSPTPQHPPPPPGVKLYTFPPPPELSTRDQYHRHHPGPSPPMMTRTVYYVPVPYHHRPPGPSSPPPVIHHQAPPPMLPPTTHGYLHVKVPPTPPPSAAATVARGSPLAGEHSKEIPSPFLASPYSPPETQQAPLPPQSAVVQATSPNPITPPLSPPRQGMVLDSSLPAASAAGAEPKLLAETNDENRHPAAGAAPVVDKGESASLPRPPTLSARDRSTSLQRSMSMLSRNGDGSAFLPRPATLSARDRSSSLQRSMTMLSRGGDGGVARPSILTQRDRSISLQSNTSIINDLFSMDILEDDPMSYAGSSGSAAYYSGRELGAGIDEKVANAWAAGSTSSSSSSSQFVAAVPKKVDAVIPGSLNRGLNSQASSSSSSSGISSSYPWEHHPVNSVAL